MSEKKDAWLEAFCPQEACLSEEEKPAATAEDQSRKRDGWLETFCPEDSCRIDSPDRSL